MLNIMAAIAILIKKNYLYEIRTWKWLLAEVLVIIILYGLAVIRSTNIISYVELTKDNINSIKYANDTKNLNDMIVDTKYFLDSQNQKDLQIFYAPVNNITSSIMNKFEASVGLGKSKGFQTESQLNLHFDRNKVLAGIIFDSSDETEQNLIATIKFPSEFRTLKFTNLRNCKRFWLTRLNGKANDANEFNDLYLREGFLQIQHQLFVHWLRASKAIKAPEFRLASFGQKLSTEPDYEDSSCFENITGFAYWFTYFLPFIGLVKKFAAERENNIQLHFLKYGVKHLDHWIAHFVVSLGHFVILNLIIMVFMWAPWIDSPWNYLIANLNPFYLFLYLMMNGAAIISYSMLLTSLIPKIYAAQLIAIALWLFGYGGYSQIFNNATEELHFLNSTCFLIFPNTYFPYGLSKLQATEDLKEIIFVILISFGLLKFHLLLLSFVDYGKIAILPYYERENKFNGNYDSDFTNNIEHGPVAEIILEMKNVSTPLDDKQNPSTSLKNISIQFFENEITVIFGAKNSGKKRILNILAGYDSKYENSVLFQENTDIRNNMLLYLKNMDAMISDVNPLFDQLTVHETLKIFIDLKQNNMNAIQKSFELEKWLNVVKPSISKKDTPVKDLSYGQKRLINLCCTLSCNRKIILLNEPTLHMENLERFLFWHILKQERFERSIILTTVEADEAERIADRVAFLDQGQLVAYGSQYFLKNLFHKFLKLVIFKETMKPITPITEVLQNYIDTPVIHGIFSDRVIYYLPEEKRSIYQRLFLDLEKDSENLGITRILVQGSGLMDSYTVAITKEQKQALGEALSATVLQSLNDIFKEKPIQTKGNQRSAMFYKKYIYQTVNIIPVVILIIGFLLIYFHESLLKSENVGSRDKIILGLKHKLSSVLSDCKYLEITELSIVNYISRYPESSFEIFDKDLKCGNEAFPTARTKYTGKSFGAVETDDHQKYTIWINEAFFHSSALALNLAHNWALSKHLASYSYPFVVKNKPMPAPLNLKVNFDEGKLTYLHLPIVMGILMPLTISAIIMPLVEERQNHMFTLQRLSGIEIVSIWCIHFIWDFGLICIIEIIYFIILHIFTFDGYTSQINIVLLILFAVYGLSSLVFIYCLAFNIQPKWKGYWISVIIQTALGLCAYVFYWDVTNNNAFIFYSMLLISPTFALMDGMASLFTYQKIQINCNDQCNIVDECKDPCNLRNECCNPNFFQWPSPGVLPSVIFMTTSGCLWTIILFGLYYYRSKKFYSPPKNPIESYLTRKQYNTTLLTAYKQEAKHKNQETSKFYQILVHQIEYEVPKNANDIKLITLAFERNSIVGIYGGKKSGKSHLLRQLVGEDGFWFGDVYICGHHLKSSTSQALKYLGYCPQQEGCFDTFTSHQLLRLLLLGSGASPKQIQLKIKNISLILNLNNYLNLRFKELPYSIKRKVNIAAALFIGAPNKVIVLDEPTRGLPLKERLLIWQTIKYVSSYDNTIIIATTDSQELEKLADFVVIVDKGEMLATGSTQYLRQKYKTGFFLEIKLRNLDGLQKNLNLDVENLNRFVMFLHEDSELVNRKDDYVKYYIPEEHITYSYLFSYMENNRHRLNIAEYTLQQGSMLMALEHIIKSKNQNA